MNRRPGHVTVTVETGYCSFCGRPRNLRREEHQLGTLVRTIITCETCHRTLSSSIGIATAEPELETAEAVAAPTPAPDAVESEAPAAPKAKPAAKEQAAPKAAPKRAAPAARSTASKKSTPKKRS